MPEPTYYCTEDELLVGNDVTWGPGEKQRFVKFASEEMDGKIGYLYVVPLGVSGLPHFQRNLIHSIAVKLATGRLLMSQGGGEQKSEPNAYAAYLIKEATIDLMSIANGQVDLKAPRVDDVGGDVGEVDDPSVADPYARIPSGWNPDQVSAVTVFERNYQTDQLLPSVFRPNENIDGEGRFEKIR